MLLVERKRQRQDLWFKMRSYVRNSLWLLRRKILGPVTPYVIGSQAPTPLPEMVIFIMDGNGRYAKKHGKPKLWGHQQGVVKAREMLEALKARGISKAGVWAASTDNYNNRPDEIVGIEGLLSDEIAEIPSTMEQVRVRFCGALDKYVRDPDLLQAIRDLEHDSSVYDYLELTIFLAYGGEEDMRQMAVQCAIDLAKQGVKPEDFDTTITTEFMHERMLSRWIPNKNVLVFRSGEDIEELDHTSDFLPRGRGIMWRHTTTLWPEFTTAELDLGLEAFGKCSRLQGAPRT